MDLAMSNKDFVQVQFATTDFSAFLNMRLKVYVTKRTRFWFA
jgi:hypothetical protein